ncbi:MAG: alpha/beta hydrolase [Chloroflexi bacterium]|nr:alpha/beta hydrolase [Chloroflexota bacterium]
MVDYLTRHAFVAVFLLMLAAACGGAYSPESRLVEVNGHRLNIRCSGDGAPTAVLVSGLATDNHDWVEVEKQVSEFSQVCSYDRTGLGKSDSATDMLTAQTASDNLHELLSVSGIGGPVILVGHSYGGLITQLYAAQHPEDTFGVVLVDSLHHENLERARLTLGEGSMGLFMAALNANPEDVDIPTSLEQVREVNLGDTPLTVLTAGEANLPPIIDPAVGSRLVSAWLYSQRELAGLSTTGVQFVAEGSGHCIQCDRPDVVVDAIKEMADGVRFQ